MTRPAVGVGKWIGRISVSVSATADRNFRRETAACLPSQSTRGDQSGSRHWMMWCIMSPVTTARCPREKMLTQQWQGECPGVGVGVMVSSRAKSSSTRSAWPASTIGRQLSRKTVPGGAARVLGFPGRIFFFMKYVFRIRECRHPAPATQRGVPAGMVDMKMRAEHIVDVVVSDAEREQLVAPAPLARKIERRRLTLVLAGAGVDQDRIVRRGRFTMVFAQSGDGALQRIS